MAYSYTRDKMQRDLRLMMARESAWNTKILFVPNIQFTLEMISVLKMAATVQVRKTCPIAVVIRASPFQLDRSQGFLLTSSPKEGKKDSKVH